MKRTPKEVIASILANLRMAHIATLEDAQKAFNANKCNETDRLLARGSALQEAINLILTETQGIE